MKRFRHRRSAPQFAANTGECRRTGRAYAAPLLCIIPLALASAATHYDIAFSTLAASSYAAQAKTGYTLYSVVEPVATPATSADRVYTLEDGFLPSVYTYLFANGFD